MRKQRCDITSVKMLLCQCNSSLVNPELYSAPVPEY